MGCSPWGRKELDTTERLTLHFTGPLTPVCQGSGVIDPFLREIACAGNKQTPPLALNQEKLAVLTALNLPGFFPTLDLGDYFM